MSRTTMTVGVEPEPFPTQEMRHVFISLSIPDNCYILSGAWCLSSVAIHSSMIYELQMSTKEESIRI